MTTSTISLYRLTRTDRRLFSFGRLPLFAAFVGTLLVLAPLTRAGASEIESLRADIEKIKQQMLYLQNQIPGAGAAGTGAASANVAAQQEVRLSQLEQQLSQLTGQIEQVNLKLDDIASRLDKFQKDAEFRLNALEANGGQGSGAPANAVQGGAQTGTEPGAASNSVGGSNPPVILTPPATSGTGSAAPQSSTAPRPQGTQVLGTLTQSEASRLPVAPPGAAEAAAAAAAGTAPSASDPGAGGANSASVGAAQTPAQQYERATALLQKGNYAEAESAFKTFISQHPKDPLAGNAQYWLGETYYARNDFKNAAVAFAEGYQKYPNSAKAADNLLKLGMSLGQSGQKENACTALRQIDKQFPDAPATIKDRAKSAKRQFACK